MEKHFYDDDPNNVNLSRLLPGFKSYQVDKHNNKFLTTNKPSLNPTNAKEIDDAEKAHRLFKQNKDWLEEYKKKLIECNQKIQRLKENEVLSEDSDSDSETEDEEEHSLAYYEKKQGLLLKKIAKCQEVIDMGEPTIPAPIRYIYELGDDSIQQTPTGKELLKSSAVKSPQMQEENSFSMSNISMMVLGGFIATAGIAAVALAFTALNAATLGIAGVAVAGIGVTAALSGIGLFAMGSCKNKNTTPNNLSLDHSNNIILM